MEYRQLGNSGLKVSVLTMGTMTFGGKGNFAKVGNVQLDEVRKLHKRLKGQEAELLEQKRAGVSVDREHEGAGQ